MEDFQTKETSPASSMLSSAFNPCPNTPWVLPALKPMPKITDPTFIGLVWRDRVVEDTIINNDQP
jgi:hypothetical protein